MYCIKQILNRGQPVQFCWQLGPGSGSRPSRPKQQITRDGSGLLAAMSIAKLKNFRTKTVVRTARRDRYEKNVLLYWMEKNMSGRLLNPVSNISRPCIGKVRVCGLVV